MPGVLRTKVLWDDTPVELEDFTRISIRKGADIKHNTCDVTLQNAVNAEKDYIKNGKIQFSPEQQLDVYAVWDDGSGVDVLSNDNLLFSGRVVEFGVESTPDKTPIKIMCSDSSFIVLNKLWVGDETGTPPEIIQSVLGWVNDGVSKAEDKVSYALTTSGGYIAAQTSSSTTFSDINVAKVFKPAYEVIQDVSQPDRTGEEVPYRFHIDKDNKFHWFYPNDAAKHMVVEGATTAQTLTYKHPITEVAITTADTNIHRVKSIKMKNAVYDIVNYIIYKAGEDMNGNQVLFFAYDPTSGSPVIKDSFRNWEDIARAMKSADAAAGNITKTSGDTYSYPVSYGGGLNPAWNTAATVNSDSEYNDAFIVEARNRANSLAEAEFKKTGNPRWKGKIEVEGSNVYNANDGLVLVSQRLGIDRVYFRITDVQHTIGKDGWFTSLELEEESP